MLKKIPFKIVTINKESNYAMEGLNNIKYTFFIVIDKNKHVVGSITDGDIRRSILKGVNVNDKVVHCMNKNPILANEKRGKTFLSF